MRTASSLPPAPSLQPESRAPAPATDRATSERVFLAATTAVNRVLGSASTRHDGRSCPGWAHTGRTGLAYCDLGCYDDALDLLADVLARLDRADRPPLDAYIRRTATAALGELHRRRRKRLGLPQRPERVADADWAVRALPDPADRELLAHLLTWLGSAAPAAGEAGAGWPVAAWSARYGVPPATMSAWIDRVVNALHTADPQRHRRYIVLPLAAKPQPVAALYGEELCVG